MFKGQTVVVTGAATGIGRATAEHLGALGANVIVADVSGGEGEAAVEAILKLDGRACFFECDVTDQASTKAMIDHAVETYGKLDLAVNCAGTAADHRELHELPVEEFDKAFDVDLRGTFLCMRAELAVMVEAGRGAIVNLICGAGATSTPGLGGQTASRHALVGLTRDAAQQYARRSIRINAVCPGPVLTEELIADPAQAQASWAEAVPLGRLGRPGEIAEAVAFLLSERASFITGVTLAADGGLVLA
jgi:NAD(P)-dependent dehydrogenase (short-subunit alcohol dehydrogenase family)